LLLCLARSDWQFAAKVLYNRYLILFVPSN
jgi:hypothetical protein